VEHWFDIHHDLRGLPSHNEHSKDNPQKNIQVDLTIVVTID